MTYFCNAKCARERIQKEYESGKTLNLKIGIDTGRTLVRLAKCRKDEFFWGVEIKDRECELAATRLKASNLKNSIVTCSEAKLLLTEMQLHNYIDVVHIYFPTPPEALKKLGLSTDEKLLSDEFLDILWRSVRVGGIVRILTDLKDYFEEFEQAVNLVHWWPRMWSHYDCNQSEGTLIGSPCENRFRGEGANIHSIMLQRL